MKFCVLDVGGTFVKSAVMDEHANIISRNKISSECEDVEGLLKILDEIIEPLVNEVTGIAISMPGKIDQERGIACTGGKFTFIKDLPIVSLLEEKYHLPVTVENDGKAAANAENWIGALKDVKNALVMILGTGIGGGIIINDQVIKGSHYTAGELSFGLINKDVDGFEFPNLITNVSSTKGLLQLYKEASNEEVDGEEFFKRANNGDEVALATLGHYAKITANYIYELQAILDVDRVAIGGGVSEQPLLLEVLNEELDKIFSADDLLTLTRPELVKCQFGNDANLIGALKVLLDSKIINRR